MGSTSKLITGFSLWIVALSAYAQTPFISTIDKSSAGIGKIVTIAGSGFDNSASNLIVQFGAVKAVIVTATENLLEVEVPSGATLGSISVTHKTSGKIGYSKELFYMSYGGEAFDVNKLDAPLQFSTTDEQFDICLCDFDGDDKTDIATSKGFRDISSNATDISVYHNTGSNSVSFTELNKSTNTELDLSSLTRNIYCTDINGDGKPEIVASRDGSVRNSIFVLRNISTVGSIKFDTPIQLFLLDGDRAQRVNIRDLDGDGKPEVIVSNTAVNTFSVFVNNSTTSALNLNTRLIFEVEGTIKTGGLDVEDLNGDGLPEIITNPNQSSDVFIKTNTSSAGNIQFGSAVKTSLTININDLFLADIDGDQKPDIVATLFFNNFLGIKLNTSTDASISFGAVQTFDTKTKPWSMDFGDVDGNGLTDIIVSSSGPTGGGVELFINTSTAGTLNLQSNEISTVNSQYSKIGDVSGDGKPDLIYTTFDGGFNLNIVRNGICLDPVVFPPEPLTICTGETKRLEVPFAPFVNYVWTKDAVAFKNSADPFVDITAAGVYQVTAEGEGGACAVVQSVTVTSDPTSAPTLSPLADPQPVCIGETLDVTGPPVGAGIIYAWTGPNNFTSDQKDLSILDMRLDKAGRYFLKVIDGVCESNEISILVQVISPPSASIQAGGLTAFCQGGSVGLSVTNDPNFNYQWFKDDIIFTGETSSTLTATDPASYTIELSLIAGTCTFVTDPVIVSILQPPTADFNADTEACVGDVITFENTSITTETPNHLWNFGDGTAPATVENPTHEYTATGTYTVTYTVTYADPNCIGSKMQDIVVSEPTAFILAVNPDPTVSDVCEGDTITISLDGTFTSYLWSTAETTSTIDVTQDGSYRIDAINAAGCVSTDSISVSFLPAPVITITADTTSITAGETIQLVASGADTYIWSPSDVEVIDNAMLPDPLVTPPDTTIFTVVGIGANGCEGLAEVTINVIPPTTEILAEKAFTPNGDSVNDTWLIAGIENQIYDGCRLIIFDRQGTSVFETQSYTNTAGWDGISSTGNQLPQGAYYWILKCGNEVVKTGSVTIIR